MGKLETRVLFLPSSPSPPTLLQERGCLAAAVDDFFFFFFFTEMEGDNKEQPSRWAPPRVAFSSKNPGCCIRYFV